MPNKAPHPTSQHDPLILIVPESAETSPDHWQSRWERNRGNCQRLDLGMWDDPHRNTWINKLNLAIYRGAGSSGRPVLLVGHGLGALTIAWWAEYERPTAQGPVIGALLIAPPDPDQSLKNHGGQDPRLAKFAATPRRPLPFPAVVVASANDPNCSLRSAIHLARDWDCRFAEAGPVGHLDTASGVGDWAIGKRLLGRLLQEHRPGSYDGPLLHSPAPRTRTPPLASLDS